jgi:hypothetical protein
MNALSPVELALIAQLGGVCGFVVLVWLLSDLSARSRSACFLLPLVLTLWLVMGEADEAIAQTTPDSYGIQQPVPTINRNGLILPDWSKINFDNLPAMLEAGSLQLPQEAIDLLGYDPSAAWNAGDKVADVLKLGSVAELGVGEMDLKQIDSILGQSSQKLSLSQYLPVQYQNLGSLTQAVPKLGDFQIKDVQSVADLIAGKGGNIPGLSVGGFVGGQISIGTGENLPFNLQNMQIGDFLKQFPLAGNLNLKDLNLSQYKIESIPNLNLATLKEFKDWENAVIKGVPGLDKVPFSKLPNPLSEGQNPFVARVDVPLDNQEQDRERSLSGSYQEGFRVPCESSCVHAELTPIGGSQMDKANAGAFANGKVWISGKAQKVKGGFGVLGKVAGGKEPTGRNPYGSILKQVITTVDQAKGNVGTSIYFRVCKRGTPDLGCTPYIVGPVPFLQYHEEQFLFLGEGNPKDDGKGLDTFNQAEDPLSGQDGFTPDCSMSLSGDAVNKAISASRNPSKAKQHVGIIMGALKEQGITDPAQIAYVLATVEHESDGFNTLKEYGGRSQAIKYGYSGGENFYGRGYVQLTHDYNYIQFGKLLGMDLKNNPDQAARPDVAAKILAIGMKKGLYRPGNSLGTYINGNRVDFYNAREIVNAGHDRAADIAGYAQKYYNAIKTADISKLKSTNNCGSATGDINKRIYHAAVKSVNDPALNLCGDGATNGGRVGCMKNVNRVLQRAGLRPLNAQGGLSIIEASELNLGKRTKEVSYGEAQPGDLVVVDAITNGHIGICLNAGCTQTISNSSSACSRGGNNWSFKDGRDFLGIYGSTRPRIYRVMN